MKTAQAVAGMRPMVLFREFFPGLRDPHWSAEHPLGALNPNFEVEMRTDVASGVSPDVEPVASRPAKEVLELETRWKIQ